MASFSKDNTTRTPFGKNQYLRSTRGLGFESYTLGAHTVPTQTIDGFTEKYLQPGTVMARITASGAHLGKIGPYQPGDDPGEVGNAGAATDGRETPANIVGVLETFLPWQTTERDVEVAVCYRGAVVQNRCYELVGATAFAALSATTRDDIIALPSTSLTFH